MSDETRERVYADAGLALLVPLVLMIAPAFLPTWSRTTLLDQALDEVEGLIALVLAYGFPLWIVARTGFARARGEGPGPFAYWPLVVVVVLTLGLAALGCAARVTRLGGVWLWPTFLIGPVVLWMVVRSVRLRKRPWERWAILVAASVLVGSWAGFVMQSTRYWATYVRPGLSIWLVAAAMGVPMALWFALPRRPQKAE